MMLHSRTGESREKTTRTKTLLGQDFLKEEKYLKQLPRDFSSDKVCCSLAPEKHPFKMRREEKKKKLIESNENLETEKVIINKI